MRPSLRFLVLVGLAWVGVRAATLGVLPGASVLHVAPTEAHPAQIAATQFPAIEPIPVASPTETPPFQTASMPAPSLDWLARLRSMLVPVRAIYAPAAAYPAQGRQVTVHLDEPRPRYNLDLPQLDEWPLAHLASAGRQPARSETVVPLQSTMPEITLARLDRIQLSMWSLLRSSQALTAAPSQALAPNGMLGGSQAGARLVYNLTSQIGAALRTSSEVGRRGGEVALGLRLHPLQSIPIWITAERRQMLGSTGGGRNAFALFAEGGLYDRTIPAGFLLSAYGQGGVVGFKRRDLFAEGALTVSHPVYKQFSAGFGAWGGVQPGLYRVDVGPRVTMQVRRNVRVHFDWRQRVAGNALPGSGPAVTLGGDF
jgi:hypothetical protein